MKKAASVTLLLLLVACGGGGAGDSGPTKADFIAAADAICADATTKTEALDAPESIDDVKDFGEKADEIGAAEMADLRALDVPAGDEDQIDPIFDKFQEGFDLLGELVDAAESQDQVRIQQIIEDADKIQTEGNALAEAYGMKDCSEE